MKKIMIGSLILLLVVLGIPGVKAINYTLTNQDIPHNAITTGDGKSFDVSYSDTLRHSIAFQANTSTSFNSYDHIYMGVTIQRRGFLLTYSDITTKLVYMDAGTPNTIANFDSYENGTFRYKYDTRVKEGLYGNFKGTIDLFGV